MKFIYNNKDGVIFMRKKYNVGLVLDGTIEEYKKFLDKYSKYIYSIYFSLPLGRKFHSRVMIAKQFEHYNTIEVFWKKLELIQKYDINLELVLNTYNLNENDIRISKEELDSHNIKIDSVSFLDEYYPWVSNLFYNQKKVFSYNNGIRTIEELLNISNKYDYYVLGSNLMRNLSIKKYIVDQLNSKVILLVNNGCSFDCSFCRKANLCISIFEKNLKLFDINELYAKQSFLPSELKYALDNNREYINLIKISCRSSNLDYLYKCLDSYIDCKEEKYIDDEKKNFNLWCRLALFGKYYEQLDYFKIKFIKKGLENNEGNL